MGSTPAFSTAAAFLALAGGTARAQVAPPSTPRALFQAACAACHGADGTGAPRSTVGFEEALPDFSDCSFATREPDADWHAIVHEGGPVRGFSRMMPAFGAALSDEEIQRALDHIRAFCKEDGWPRGELNLPRALVTEKAYPEDEAVWTTTVAAEGAGSVLNQLVYERRFGARSQVELVVPFGWTRAAAMDGSGWTSGIGDVAAAFKHTLYHDLAAGSILSAAAEVSLPTGKAGFTTGTTVVEPFLAFGQILPANAFVHVQAGAELPFDHERAEREGFGRAALGITFAGDGGFGRAWTPLLEVLASRELESGAATTWDLLPQLQVTLSRRQHVMASLGVRVPVNDAPDRPTQILAYLLWDWFDGGLFDGW